MSDIKIVILDGFVANSDDLSWEDIAKQGELYVYPRTEKNEVIVRCQGATAVFTNKVPFDAETFDALPDLKFIGVLATGYNIIDLDAARRHGVTVCNVPAYSSDSVAQLTFALLLSITNRVADYFAGVSLGDWSRCIDFSYRLAPISELSGKTMGIYGLGNIGQTVAGIAHAFGMKVISPTSKPQDKIPPYVEKVSLEEMFGRSDVLTLHAPLTDRSRNIINAGTLSLMKPSAILINTARGGLVDEKALAEALEKGVIAAVAVDVLEQEPPRDGSPLLTAPHCYVTPHIAWESTEARTRLLEISADNLRLFLAGKPQNVVS